MFAHGLTPILNVSDLLASIAWFERLGWKKNWVWERAPGAAPSFGSVGSGICQVFLCQDGQGGRGKSSLTHTGGPDGRDDQERGVWLSIWVDDVDKVHRDCVAQGVEVTHGPTDEEWGVREFHVRHPDGHVFRISRGISGGG
jgi:catechol 2,3-dioxygenase-like lactoylglutathione lyase family enzyme